MKKNKIIKLLFSIVLFFIITISFSACAQVRVMTITNEDSSIDELVAVTIYPQSVIDAGYNVIELKRDIETKSSAQAQTMKDKLNNKITNDLFLVRDAESIAILNSYKDGISVIKSEWKDNTYAIGIRFKNLDIYRYYYNIKESINVEMQTEEHFFYDKLYYYANTMYVKHNDLYNSVKSYYSTAYPNLIESENNELLYSYKSDLRRQHSDADYITKHKGYYYHTWVVSPDNIEDTIMLYYNVPNPESFIIVALAITFGVTIILLGVGVLKFKLKNKKADTN